MRRWEPNWQRRLDEAMTPSDRASVRAAGELAEAVRVALRQNEQRHPIGHDAMVAMRRKLAAWDAIGHPAPDPPGDALKDVLLHHRPVILATPADLLGSGDLTACPTVECICGEKITGYEKWVEHVLALLAAPRTEGK